MPADLVEAVEADLEAARTELSGRLDDERHPAVRQDLEILLDAAELMSDELRLEDSYLRRWILLAGRQPWCA